MIRTIPRQDISSRASGKKEIRGLFDYSDKQRGIYTIYSTGNSVIGVPMPNTPKSLPGIHEVIGASGRPKAVILGTRIAVRVIENYRRMGYTAQRIVDEVYPHLKIEQVNDALTYSDSHRESIEQEISENTEEYARNWLQSHNLSFGR
ncbi:MAG: DUF433 domain-containing protein [Chloroflexi bacterium]|nr:DUF433 domain-containing protein [Chloroflexota bacterium]